MSIVHVDNPSNGSWALFLRDATHLVRALQARIITTITNYLFRGYSIAVSRIIRD